MNARLEERTAARAPDAVLGSEVAPVGTFTVRRALPARDRHAIGPWVFLDHFGPMRVTPGVDGVGPHPHAGIETVTYLFSGRNEHRDSAGHTGIVSAGGAQWMTSGRGVVHAERPLAESEGERTMHGIQLWTSLPRALKGMAPRYQRIDAAAIPRVERGGSRVAVVAGQWGGEQGPADVLMPIFLLHASVAPGASFELEPRAGEEVGVYVVQGTAQASGTAIAAGELAAWDAGTGTIRVANAGDETLEAMVLGGAPAEGPLVFHGPFVMNSVEQVRAAEIAYRTGRMGDLEE